MRELTTASWAEYKATVIDKKNLKINYQERANAYDIFAQEGLFLWSYTIVKDGKADVVDFETNVKPTANA